MYENKCRLLQINTMICIVFSAVLGYTSYCHLKKCFPIISLWVSFPLCHSFLLTFDRGATQLRADLMIFQEQISVRIIDILGVFLTSFLCSIRIMFLLLVLRFFFSPQLYILSRFSMNHQCSYSGTCICFLVNRVVTIASQIYSQTFCRYIAATAILGRILDLY